MAGFVLLTLIHWIAIYPEDSVIQPLNNRGQAYKNRYAAYNKSPISQACSRPYMENISPGSFFTELHSPSVASSRLVNKIYMSVLRGEKCILIYRGVVRLANTRQEASNAISN